MEFDGDGAAALHSMAEVKQRHPQVPVLAIVDRGDIPATVQAMRAGATNCLERPVETEPLTSAVSELLDQIDTQSDDSAAPLTRMETTVLQYILHGRTNRQIAEALHRSPRTIEVHRRHIMRKLGASTIVDLVKAAGLKGSA
jgi:two-component system response regulator FixJ